MPSKKPPIPSPATPLPEVKLPLGPYIERTAGATPTITPNGLAAIELLASEGLVLSAIASQIGLSAKQLKTLLGAADADPMTEARAAWQAGRGRLESELVRLALASARRGGMIQQLFLLKSQFGHRDQGPQTVIEGPRIAFLLPGPLPESDYLKKLGIAAPIDTRPEDMRGLSPFEIMGLPSPSPSNPTTAQGENENVEESKA